MILNIANIFDVSTDYLLGRIDNPQHKIVPKEELPLELAKYVDYIEIFKGYSVEDISPEELREVIEFAKKSRKGERVSHFVFFSSITTTFIILAIFLSLEFLDAFLVLLTDALFTGFASELAF